LPRHKTSNQPINKHSFLPNQDRYHPKQYIHQTTQQSLDNLALTHLTDGLNLPNPLKRLIPQFDHHALKLLNLPPMLVLRLGAERYPTDIPLLVLATVHAHLYFVLQAAELCLGFCVQAVHVVDVVPQEVLLQDVGVEVLVCLV